MTPTGDAYWDELGIAWSAINPDPDVVVLRLKSRLRWQTALIRIAVIGGLPLSLLGLALGVWTIWAGWSGGAWNFVTRGIAILAISTMLGFASWLVNSGAKDPTRSLAEMIDLAILRSENFLRAIRLGYYGCIVAAVFGMIGYEMRSHFSKPPAMSPIEPLSALALFALVLFLYHRKVTDSVARYRYLKRLLAAEG